MFLWDNLGEVGKRMIHPACSICKGACCEYFIIPYKVRLEGNKKWIEAHGYLNHHPVVGKNGVEITIPCQYLDSLGRCLIYDKRFPACKEHPVGGDMCINAIKKMRPEDERKKIMEAME